MTTDYKTRFAELAPQGAVRVILLGLDLVGEGLISELSLEFLLCGEIP